MDSAPQSTHTSVAVDATNRFRETKGLHPDVDAVVLYQALNLCTYGLSSILSLTSALTGALAF